MPGPHDFAVRSDLHQASSRPCAASRNFGEGVEAPFVLRAVARSRKPALRTHLRARRCRVHRIPSRVRDDRDTPLLSGKDGGGHRIESTKRGSKIFFAAGLDSFLVICPTGTLSAQYDISSLAAGTKRYSSNHIMLTCQHDRLSPQLHCRGSFFFTVNLAERRLRLLTEPQNLGLANLNKEGLRISSER
jgi:hypothetical protein